MGAHVRHSSSVNSFLADKTKLFATVGNEEKRRHLMEKYSIPPNRIFNSRDSSFLHDVLRETNGKGVDLVLNSLSGELLHASWQCVAEFGKMLEIGKRDFIGRGRLAMNVFEANRSFVGVDLDRVCRQRPQVCKRLVDTLRTVDRDLTLSHRLLEQCMTYYRQGLITPIQPVTRFEASKIQDCFRYMQKGQHIGKIVVAMPESYSDLEAESIGSEFVLSPDASYLLVGGLGGLGRAISVWLAEHGARHLTYLSRSAGEKAEDKSFFQELASQGCEAQAVIGSVSNFDDVQSAVSKSGRPVRGMIQMSMVLRVCAKVLSPADSN